ncbi:hypothetical protein MUA03_17485 [Enterobacteriaceae bacterium H16N7]|nr:hypothetical protein [Dryocola clanedunensis]
MSSNKYGEEKSVTLEDLSRELSVFSQEDVVVEVVKHDKNQHGMGDSPNDGRDRNDTGH